MKKNHPDNLPQLLHEFFDELTQPILWNRPIWDSSGENIIDFEYFYANAEGLRYLNLGPGAIPGLLLSTTPTVNEDLRQEFLQEMTNICHTGKKVHRTLYNGAIDKHSKITRIAFKGGVLTIVQDITEELKRIQELQEQKALSELMVSASLNPVCVLEAVRDASDKIVDLCFLQVNRRYEKLVGKTANQLLGQPLLRLFPSAKASGTLERHIQVIKTGLPARYEIYRNGEEVEGWFDISAVKIGTNKVFVTYNDITEQKRNQQHLEHSEKQLKEILETQLSYVYVYSPVFDDKGDLINFRYKMINRSGRKLLPEDCKDAEGKLLSDVFPSYTSSANFRNHVQAYFASEPTHYQIPFDANGRHVWLDSLATRIGSDLLVCHQDLTKSKELQLRLEGSIAELKRSNANLEEFAHAASHDLKEPVRKVHFYVERLKTKLSDRVKPDENQLFERVENAMERMRSLIDDLLEYSHVSYQHHQQEKIDLNGKLQAVLADLEVSIREKNASVTVGPLPVIKGYRRQLQQLFQNLVANALKYNKPGETPVIEICSTTLSDENDLGDLPPRFRSRRYHLITVKDNGIGFEQEDAERIFNMFTRLHGNAEYKGTGVGLSIVRKVVENHHGFIKAESSPGNGARFKVYLPADED